MRVLGIDGGLTGGAAVLVTGGDLDGPARCAGAIDIPTRGDDAKRRVDVLELSKWIRAMSPDIAGVERAQAFRDQGASSGFIYGRAVGAIEAAVILSNVPMVIAEPTLWKKYFDLPGLAKNKRAKEIARQAALTALPNAVQFMPRMGDHGRAEGLLIAMWIADLIEAGKLDVAKVAKLQRGEDVERGQIPLLSAAE